MKKMLTMILSLAMVFTLAACGGEKDSETKAVDLNAFYNELAEKYSWVGEDDVTEDMDPESVMMMDLEGEMLESYYPGLAEINAKQFMAKASMISAVVNECVFMECENAKDAAAAAEILNNRITMQAEGGAWYPDSVEAWGKAEVITNGNFVAMIASAQNQTEIGEAFNALFA